MRRPLPDSSGVDVPKREAKACFGDAAAPPLGYLGNSVYCLWYFSSNQSKIEKSAVEHKLFSSTVRTQTDAYLVSSVVGPRLIRGPVDPSVRISNPPLR